ncbi:MAG: penicillin-binding transpeptidase domain-containing protein [Deltaproteobacteria bacterium]|nr:penicillin-binding transpeptidase domain-containing protein [Deltaproteobacteria bacterium]
MLKGGLTVRTNCDLDAQRAARRALREGLHDLTRRQGYPGPIRAVPESAIDETADALRQARYFNPPDAGDPEKGVVRSASAGGAVVDVGGETVTLPPEGVKWVSRIVRRGKPSKLGPFSKVSDVVAPGDVVLVERASAGAKTCSLVPHPASQAAIVVMSPHTREVSVIVGGYDFEESEFNRAVQAHRQPGSSFKPIVYSAALDAGMTPATHIMDTALVFADGWRPRNYSGKFSGEMTLRQALTKSVNTVTVRVAQAIGPDYIERFAKRLGLHSLAGSDLSMALGSYEVIPVELINAYAVFASGGRLAAPIYVRQVTDRNGDVLEENVLSPLVEQAPPLTGVPDLTERRKRAGFLEGDPDVLFPEPEPGQKEFLDDFQLAMRIEEL